MPSVDGETLRTWRRSRGWDVPEMARQLRRVARGPVADHDGLIRMIRDWERGRHKLTERYELLYARALAITPGQLGGQPPQAGQAAHPGASGEALTRWPASDAAAPLAVSSSDVDVIRVMLDALIASDRQFGGGHSREYATGYLTNVVQPRLNANGKEQVLRGFFTVSVEFALRVASMNLDAGHASVSRRLLGMASSIAHQTEDLSCRRILKADPQGYSES